MEDMVDCEGGVLFARFVIRGMFISRGVLILSEVPKLRAPSRGRRLSENFGLNLCAPTPLIVSRLSNAKSCEINSNLQTISSRS